MGRLLYVLPATRYWPLLKQMQHRPTGTGLRTEFSWYWKMMAGTWITS